jgi:hypothetical protein
MRVFASTLPQSLGESRERELAGGVGRHVAKQGRVRNSRGSSFDWLRAAVKAGSTTITVNGNIHFRRERVGN